MKKLLKAIFYATAGFLVLLTATTSLLLWLMGMLNKQGIEEALDFVQHNSPAAIWQTVIMDLGFYGDAEADPSYGRQTVPGRGHAPWVMRMNLDERHRILNFALAPGIWAAYQTESASLYQLWRGDILFEGSVYDYRHGPQPSSTGEWFLRHEHPPRWELHVGDRVIPASVRYLGHSYDSSRARASFEFTLRADDLDVRLSETPDLLQQDGETLFQRRIVVDSDIEQLRVIQVFNSGESRVLRPGENLLTSTLANSTPIALPQEDIAETSGDELEIGKRAVANSDCLGCHNETHYVVGPSFARIAKKFRGRMNEVSIDTLTDSIIKGSQGKWGKVPMPGHPDLSPAQARLIVAYILSLSELDIKEGVPLDENGELYPYTRDYEVGERLTGLHPAFNLENVIPEGFQPKVGGMKFRDDGKLVVASWDRDGAVFLLDLEKAPAKVTRIAEGLHEPLGLSVVGERLFVLQKQELTELIDTDGDDIIDQYRSFSSEWPTTSNFHSFAFGLVHQDGKLYGLFSMCVLPGGASCPEQQARHGMLFRVDINDGSIDFPAGGFRTPNGIALGPEGELLVNDNQGDWLPSSKLLHVEPGRFYGFKGIVDEQMRKLDETPPVVWLPQDEIGNSPTEPALLVEGPYAGQMIHGDVFHGGIKRVFMERVNGALQGAVLRFSGGFQGGVNRITRGPDGALYLGEIGNPPNWGEIGKVWHGLERLSYRGRPAYELLEVRVTAEGFDLVLTEPLADDLQVQATDLRAIQWFYHPTEIYGGPKINPTELTIRSLQLSADRRVLHADIPGLKSGYVVYLALNRRLQSWEGKKLWTNEAWYTLNAIPTDSESK